VFSAQSPCMEVGKLFLEPYSWESMLEHRIATQLTCAVGHYTGDDLL